MIAGLRPAAELATACGTRLRYIAGCRCYHCRSANSAYERERAAARKAGDWNGLVDAKRARQHLSKLRRKNVGRDAVHNASGVARSIIAQIATGERQQIRARTKRLILAVTPACREDGSLVPAGPSWRRIEALIEEGFTRVRIARELGQRGNGLQLSKHLVTARNEAKIERLYDRYMK